MLLAGLLTRAIASCPLRTFRGRLCRRVPLAALLAEFPEFDFLYASTNASRFLRKGKAQALYGSESEEVANAEFRHYQAQIFGADLPVLPDHSALFSFAADVRNILDLADPAVCQHFRLSAGDFAAEWNRPGRRLPTPLQTLGEAAFRSGKVAGIRYPSARLRGGMNLVLFKPRIVDPMIVVAEFTHASGVRREMRWPERPQRTV